MKEKSGKHWEKKLEKKRLVFYIYQVILPQGRRFIFFLLIKKWCFRGYVATFFRAQVVQMDQVGIAGIREQHECKY